MWGNIFIYFIVGGTITSLIVVLEESNFRLLSGLAALIPVFTLVSYFFIGMSKGGYAVSQHSKFVLAGTLVSWVPYMIIVAYVSPILGPNKAIAIGLLAFFFLALIFLFVVQHYGLFQ
ncbi:MAG: hypothetical protein WC878_06585 [Candidatus Paceibacterota bacterium]|jgi:uncharacterized membrane protein (GlpM family)